MLNRVLGLAGWPALVVIAGAIVAAQFLTSWRWVHRGLWSLAAVVAVIGAYNEWRK
jgi:uncharacterized membrane protein YeaQ/YmgE (transglycosylase-associated protein family)